MDPQKALGMHEVLSCDSEVYCPVGFVLRSGSGLALGVGASEGGPGLVEGGRSAYILGGQGSCAVVNCRGEGGWEVGWG